MTATITIPCARCGEPRTVANQSPSKNARAALRICRSCAARALAEAPRPTGVSAAAAARHDRRLPAHLLASIAGQTWRNRAACATGDPERFAVNERDAEGVAEAKAVCGGCPVRAECLADALAIKDPNLIAGGLTGTERVELILRRKRRAQ
ncbi:Transcription factor WhiB [Nakamurella panacisegetis]|uniref:Transcriptional regulator WhiB n=1 Tax=Nakamurella panacisegetis TaxID=1090615 RepID=A0A1H0PZT7_9ACTN|nr:WhiB family transcriptional regulator [Nakamurella panacisegetis]SDP10623.1 Transcription factor WhiB [Nakamurella panacisegetis]